MINLKKRMEIIMGNGNEDSRKDQRALLDKMVEDTFSPKVKAAYLQVVLGNRDVSFDLYRLNGYEPTEAASMNMTVNRIIEITAVNTEGGADDPVYLQFQNMRCRDLDDSCTRFVLPAAWPIEKIIDELIHTDLLVDTCDSSDLESLNLLTAVRDAIASADWRSRPTGISNRSLANWVFNTLDTYDDDPDGLEDYCKTLKMDSGDLDAHRPRTYELAVALLFDDPMGNGHANHTNGGLEEDAVLHVSRNFASIVDGDAKMRKCPDNSAADESGDSDSQQILETDVRQVTSDGLGELVATWFESPTGIKTRRRLTDESGNEVCIERENDGGWVVCVPADSAYDPNLLSDANLLSDLKGFLMGLVYALKEESTPVEEVLAPVKNEVTGEILDLLNREFDSDLHRRFWNAIMGDLVGMDRMTLRSRLNEVAARMREGSEAFSRECDKIHEIIDDLRLED